MSTAMFESLSDKVAMFNQQANSHMASQSKNPFTSGLNLDRPKFSKEEYGRPAAGSLSDIRGRKATAHILREMLELCEIIQQNGTPCKDHPEIMGITFGDLFNIYVAISDKCVGLLLRARKQGMVEFEGEVLFQRRDDDVPIFLVKPIAEIRAYFKQKIEDAKKDVH
ncbi:actin-binding Rho-activating protein isoform X1 [Diachasma alloeum]|uniref:actin-binding Rho-activating protein isoform X1 n=2 Tax=Diachasma alloeum TaxID=454923 RepID=UPI0007382CBA|nr:actin-binding Rho-activating protein isoform X1 [Diachasma alloeum]